MSPGARPRTLESGPRGADSRVAVVIATRDRRSSLLRTLERLRTLPERPPIVVVDNGSSDGTVEEVRRRHAEVDVISLGKNLGGAARTVGVRHVGTPYVAFSDDDSWWAPDALVGAADVLDACPCLAVLAARVLVGPEDRVDPTCVQMAASPLVSGVWLPGPPILGFIACGAVVRRSAYLEVGGFLAHFGIGGEEEPLAIDLAAAGWQLAYVDAVVAHHHPSPIRDPGARRRIITRNALWSAWLRRPPNVVFSKTIAVAASALSDARRRAGLVEALRGLPWVARERRVVPPPIESALRTLES